MVGQALVEKEFSKWMTHDRKLAGSEAAAIEKAKRLLENDITVMKAKFAQHMQNVARDVGITTALWQSREGKQFLEEWVKALDQFSFSPPPPDQS